LHKDSFYTKVLQLHFAEATFPTLKNPFLADHQRFSKEMYLRSIAFCWQKLKVMKQLLRLEEAGLFLLSWYFFTTTGITWWWFLVWLLAPDLSMIGYLINARIGAYLYNFFHHKGLAILVVLGGTISLSPLLAASGWLLLGHSSMDRVFGYGLKYISDFKDTHLGRIGEAGHSMGN